MDNIILVRGAGDLATGVILKLKNCGFNVVALEIEKPLAIRRQVAFSEAVYEGEYKIEKVTCKLCNDVLEVTDVLEEGNVALLIDETGESIKSIKPKVLVDAILAKKNIGTTKDMADITIGLGPGFSAGDDVDFVIETMRGHNLGRIITSGMAIENTGIPGEIKGFSKERVVYSNAAGTIEKVHGIGDIVSKGDTICYIKDEYGQNHEVLATLDGILRGLIRDGATVKNNLKIADIDPRKEEVKNTFTISDKARCIAGGVLEVIISNNILPSIIR
ncbi:EF2563 family selenium-dependent molybdenum hydroxylase system protein [Romboutsia weinsteinii]|uniref:EF2563 family selenium-dependent molybdenum hydroxylase system protein n=1 Tax=Romboutsia weinsteinii TaxID=2020949 RepID=A0A371J8H6_9FIRM|nr:selenium-dependent molybdenum cofactor biosynthesis protein YqeB [Romboutsia weinsteinii]RDY29044.1 EF2563 family selenium-dependent molybdenum hydroxylase system protein [Romboutsia weinsteinii]